MKGPVIAFHKPPPERSLSYRENTGRYRMMMSRVAQFKELPGVGDLGFDDRGCFGGVDHILADVKVFGSRQFILREKYGVNKPIILIVHVVWDWLEPLCEVAPLLRSGDIVIAPSRYAKKSLERISGRFKPYVIPPSLERLPRGTRVPGPQKRRTKKIVYMGGLHASKGLHRLIESMPAIVNEVPEAILEIIGPLSGWYVADRPVSSYVRRLRRKVSRLSLDDKVRFRGALFGRKKYRALSGCEVMVNPSTYLNETFGVVNLEALACGVPVVASRWSAHGEYIRDGHNGYLVPATYRKGAFTVHKEELVEKTVTLLKDLKRKDRLAIEARKTAKKYTTDSTARVFEKALKKRLSKHPIGTAAWQQVRTWRLKDLRGSFTSGAYFFLLLFKNSRLTYEEILSDYEKNYRRERDRKASRLEFVEPHRRKKKTLSRILRQELFSYLVR